MKVKGKKISIIAWIIFVITLAGLLMLGVVERPYELFDGKISPDWYGYALYSFISCVAIIIIAKFLNILLKRNEDYYNDGEGE